MDSSGIDSMRGALAAPILSRSSDAWVAAALADLPTLLVDHAHCERKAAQTALRLMAQHASWTRLVAEMSRLAREELVHFERVLGELKVRGLVLKPLPSAGYAAELFALVRREPAVRAVDELLICALIEARSHERFARLADAVPDPRLRAFYDDLGEAEERHGALYVRLAQELSASSVGPRLDELAAREAEIVHRPAQPLRMHAGG
jgi:tRNA-(ms[2]io[6]A)-hydroxylase